MKTLYSSVLQIEQDLQCESILDDQEEIMNDVEHSPLYLIPKIATIFRQCFNKSIECDDLHLSDSRKEFNGAQFYMQRIELSRQQCFAQIRKFKKLLEKEGINYEIYPDANSAAHEYCWDFSFTDIRNNMATKSYSTTYFKITVIYCDQITVYEAPKQFFDAL